MPLIQMSTKIRLSKYLVNDFDYQAHPRSLHLNKFEPRESFGCETLLNDRQAA